MKNDIKHLKIDLDFLDEKEPDIINIINGSSKQTPKINNNNFRWKPLLIIVGIIIFFIWISSSDSTTTDDTTKNVSVGKYTCTEYHGKQADLLSPKKSENEIDNERTSMEKRSDELDRLKNEMGLSGVDENSSQYEINQFNILVDEYNSKLNSFKRDTASFQETIDDYNAKISAYNNYLEKNCSKK